jgi:hypothetical protein
MLWLLFLLRLIVIIPTMMASFHQQDPLYQPDQWYVKSDHYPDYCSTPDQMKHRKIPPLGQFNRDAIGDTRLVHVTAVIRHGARTPWSSAMKCWDSYWDSPETGIWDCNLTTFMTQPSRKSIQAQAANDDPFFLFEKRYDALSYPQDHLTNELNGTCQVGQLLQRGHAQQITNGKILRDAYTYRKGEVDHDERMRLLDLSLQDYLPWNSDQLHFRADDDQRTVMSGHTLLRGLFDQELTKHRMDAGQIPVISLHIADRDRDVVDANQNDCPRLAAIQQEAVQSKAFHIFDNSKESMQVKNYMWNELKMSNEARNNILDCLMCTVCTDRKLPDAVNDYDGTSDNWFTRLAEYDIQTYTLIMKHNESQFAKLALGPLWYEIMKNINPYLEGDESQGTITAPKLALFSGHDTTIMPLLASIGPKLWNDTDWAPYASMLLIEIHELIDGQSDPETHTSKLAFRLIYNGKVLTQLVDNCHDNSELCDLVHLKAKVDPIATRDTDCSIPPKGAGSWTSANYSLISLSSTEEIALFVALICISAVLGSSMTCYALSKISKNAIDGRKVDHNDAAWNGSDDGGLELREGDFQDEQDL